MPVLSPPRQALQKTMAATTTDQAAHHLDTYEAIRPLNVPPSWHPGQPIKADCSKYVQFLARWSLGALDPMRNGWADWGNSSTIWMALPHITLAEALPGDICTFGFYSGDDHALMLYAEMGGSWDCANFGRQGEPVIKPLSAEILDHPGMTMTVCRLMPDPAPTHADELRAMTGFYAWLAWYLGEGPHLWKPYGPQNKAVRPKVPTTIPPDWWTHQKAFLANRTNGNP